MIIYFYKFLLYIFLILCAITIANSFKSMYYTFSSQEELVEEINKKTINLSFVCLGLCLIVLILKKYLH